MKKWVSADDIRQFAQARYRGSSYGQLHVWINMPSSLDELHARHGEKIVVVIEDDQAFEIVGNARKPIPMMALSPGWPS